MRHLLCMLLAIGFYSPYSLAAGGVTSSGGDSYAAEFTMIGRHVAEILRTHPKIGVSAKDFLRVVDSTFVISKKRTFLNGDEVEAINYPGRLRIELNRTRWRELRDKIQHRYSLVTHEYLGVMGIDDKKYQISHQLFTLPGPARVHIKCAAFDDLQEDLKNRYFLDFTFYDAKEVAIVKSDDGELLPSPVGDTMITGWAENGQMYIIANVNLGLIRSVQIPIVLQGSRDTNFTATIWDSRGFGRTAPLRQVPCEEKRW